MEKHLNTLDGYEVAVTKLGAFTGGSGERGDKDTASGVSTIFNVNGDVIVRIFGVCTVDLVGGATIEVGVTGNTAALIAQTTATDIDAGKIWNDSSPVLGVDLLASVLGPYLVLNGADIQEKIATADITAGNIYYVCLWKAVTPGSSVEGLPVRDGSSVRFDS